MSFPCSTQQNSEGILGKGNAVLKYRWQEERGEEFFGGRAQKK